MMTKNLPCLASFFLIFSLMILGGCASSKVDLKKENKNFYTLAKRAKEEMKGEAYKNWLTKMLSQKRTELVALGGLEQREDKVLGQHEAMVGSSATNGNQQDLHEFQADRSRQALFEMKQQRKMVERHIFYLNSQLSELESPLKP